MSAAFHKAVRKRLLYKLNNPCAKRFGSLRTPGYNCCHVWTLHTLRTSRNPDRDSLTTNDSISAAVGFGKIARTQPWTEFSRYPLMCSLLKNCSRQSELPVITVPVWYGHHLYPWTWEIVGHYFMEKILIFWHIPRKCGREHIYAMGRNCR